MGVQLHDVGRKIMGKDRRFWHLVVGHCHHHILRLEPAAARGHDESISIFVQPVYLHTRLNRQAEMCGIGLQVIGNLILSGESVTSTRKWQPWEPAVSCRREKTQGIPSV